MLLDSFFLGFNAMQWKLASLAVSIQDYLCANCVLSLLLQVLCAKSVLIGLSIFWPRAKFKK